MKKRLGFTLAEVLITLGIIGVVAAITIPTLMQKADKQQYLTRLKKAYAQTNEALKLMSADMGCPNDLACTGVFSGDSEAVGSELTKYFKVIKNCGTADGGGCVSNSVSTNFDGTGERENFDLSGEYSFLTEDGMAIRLHSVADNCQVNNSISGTGSMSKTCGSVIIDVNGPDGKPNNFGKDIFYFYITSGKGALLYPMGGSDIKGKGYWKDASGNPQRCDKDANVDGYACAGRIMDEGWQINYY